MNDFDFNGWTLKYDMLPKGGLVLQSIRHNKYFLANDVRVARIWVNSEDEVNSKNFYLGTDDFDVTDPTSTGEPTSFPFVDVYEIKSLPPFDVFYDAIPGIRAVYKTKNKVFGDNDDKDDDYLTITQSYSFTLYKKSPAHEPGGVLTAARIFPLIKFSYGGKKIKSLRVDYRFNFSLDFFFPITKSNVLQGDNGLLNINAINKATFKEQGVIFDVRPNMAGIFRDNEEIPSATETNFGFSNPDISAIFFAAEKPVQNEILGNGLLDGLPGIKDTLPIAGSDEGSGIPGTTFVESLTETTWDNLHQWSGYKSYKKLPSSPGAFHALHMHWRWGRVVSDPSVDNIKLWIKNILPEAGKPQFKGVEVFNNVGGPLLDPKIPNQTIKFAITKITAPIGLGKDWSAANNPSERKFENLFFVNKDSARPINEGDDIAFWLSVLVKRVNLKEPFSGTTCIHGLYFPHEPEPTTEVGNPAFFTIDKPLLQPKRSSYKSWERNPEG